MKRALLLLALAAGAAPPPWSGELGDLAEDAAAEFPGHLLLYVRDVSTGESFGRAADRPAYLSSAIKVVVMLEVLRQLDAGELSLDEPVVFGSDDVRDGVGPIQLGPPGRRFRLGELLELMMDRSDNAAADLLMRRVGVDNLNRLPARRQVRFSTIATLLDERRHIYAKLDPKGAFLTPRQVWELGQCPTDQARAELFSRMVGRSPAFSALELGAAFRQFYAEGINSASMEQVGKLLEQVARCDALSPGSCALARRLLRGCRTGAHRIRAGIPEAVEWDHKTGTQFERACDVGILYPRPDRPVVVAACAADFDDVPQVERLFASVGRAVWKSLGAAIAAAGNLGA